MINLKIHIPLFSIPGLYGSVARKRAVDFSLPLYGDTFSVAIRNPKFEIRMWNYLSPLHVHSWIGILALIGVSSMCLVTACHVTQGTN